MELARRKILLILGIGSFIRFLLMPHTSFCATWAKIDTMNMFYIYGLNPLLKTFSLGPTFWLFYLPTYVPSLILDYFGLHSDLILVTLFKVPGFLADLLVTYALYSICLGVLKKPRVSIAIAATYFLNPYVIWMSAVVGHAEQMVAAFILLTMLFLSGSRTTEAGVTFSLAAFSRVHAAFMLPLVLVHLIRCKNKKSRGFLCFLGSFSVTSAALAIPYLAFFADIYRSLGSNSWKYLNSLSFGLTTMGQALPHDFVFNFTSLIAQIGLWSTLESFFDYRLFVIVFLFITVVLIVRFKPSLHTLNRGAILLFSSFMLIVPLCQHHYLSWLLPFLLLEVIVFRGLPAIYTAALWVSWCIIDLVIQGYFLVYPIVNAEVLTGLWRNWPLNDLGLVQAMSALSGSLLIVVVLHALMHGPRENSKRPACEIKRTSGSLVFPVLFVLYCLFEIARVAYPPFQISVYAPLSIGFSVGIYALWRFWRYVDENSSLVSSCDQLFSSNGGRIIAGIQMGSVAAGVVTIALLSLDLPVFLLLQLVFLTLFWAVNRGFDASLKMYRYSFLFTLLYLFYLTVTANCQAMILLLQLYMVSSLYILIKLDRLHGQAVENKSKPSRRLSKARGFTGIGRLVNIATRHTGMFALLAFALLPITYLPFRYTGVFKAEPVYSAIFDFPGSFTYSNGYVKVAQNAIQLGDFDYDQLSMGEWSFSSLPIFSYLSDVTIRLEGLPQTYVKPQFEIENVLWEDSSFLTGWKRNPDLPWLTVSTDGDVVTFQADLDAVSEAEREPYYLFKDLGGNLSADDAPYLVVKYKSTAPIARFDARIGGISVVYRDQQDSDSEWVIDVLKLPPGEVVDNVMIGWNPPSYVTGVQTVAFDHMMLCTGRFEEIPSVQLVFNDQQVFNENLTASAGDIYTVPAAKQQKGTGLELVLSPENLVELNFMRVDVDRNVVWNITSITMDLRLRADSTGPPYWRSQVAALFAVFALEVMGLLTALLMLSKSFLR